MHQDKLVFSQLMLCLPLSTFRRCVAEHNGEHKIKDSSCLDQFSAMAFAQLTYRESLRASKSICVSKSVGYITWGFVASRFRAIR